MLEVSWLIPMEAVRVMTGQIGAQVLHRIEMRPGVRLDPQARLSLTENGFAAHVVYEEPLYPGLKQRAAIQLLAVPKENAFVENAMEGHRT